MKVKFIASLSGIEFTYKPGDVAELDFRTAESWIAAELCVPVAAEPKPSDPKPSKKSK